MLYSGNQHHHADDNAPTATWLQNVLTFIGLLAVVLGAMQYLAWAENDKNFVPGLLSALLICLLLAYRAGFIKARDLCQICFPSRKHGW